MIRLVCAVLRKTVTNGMRSSSQVIVRHQPLWQWPHRGYYFPHALSKSSPWQSRSKQRYYWARHQATDNRQYHIYGQEWKYIHVQHQRASERCILTNDWEMSEKEVIEYYNLRGARERDFVALNNDFGWSHLPCSFLNENTVFPLLMTMCKNFYTAILYEIGKVFSNIKPKHRLKKFIYRFISVPAKWVRTARTHVLRLFTDRPYDRLNLFWPLTLMDFLIVPSLWVGERCIRIWAILSIMALLRLH